jgi:hypothetical protein
VRVVGVNPGIVATDRFMRNIRQRATKIRQNRVGLKSERFADWSPGKPEEIDGIISLLAGQLHQWCNITIEVSSRGCRLNLATFARRRLAIN